MGAPFEKALHLKNVGQAPAVFTFEGKHVPPGVVISPQRGSVGPGGTQEVMVEYTAPKSQLVEATLVAEVRCGKPVKLAMAAEACVPEVAVAEDELDFGGLVVGASSKQPLTLVNRSAVTAMLFCDLSDQPEFELQLFKPGGDDDGGGDHKTEKTSTVAGGEEEEAELPLTLVEQPKGLKGEVDQSAADGRAVSTSPPRTGDSAAVPEQRLQPQRQP